MISISRTEIEELLGSRGFYYYFLYLSLWVSYGKEFRPYLKQVREEKAKIKETVRSFAKKEQVKEWVPSELSSKRRSSSRRPTEYVDRTITSKSYRPFDDYDEIIPLATTLSTLSEGSSSSEPEDDTESSFQGGDFGGGGAGGDWDVPSVDVSSVTVSDTSNYS